MIYRIVVTEPDGRETLNEVIERGDPYARFFEVARDVARRQGRAIGHMHHVCLVGAIARVTDFGHPERDVRVRLVQEYASEETRHWTTIPTVWRCSTRSVLRVSGRRARSSTRTVTCRRPRTRCGSWCTNCGRRSSGNRRFCNASRRSRRSTGYSSSRRAVGAGRTPSRALRGWVRRRAVEVTC